MMSENILKCIQIMDCFIDRLVYVNLTSLMHHSVMKPCVTETVQWSVSAPALRLLISSGSDRVQSISMVGSEMLPLCFVHRGSLLLCAASSGAGSLSPAPRLSVRFYFAPRLSLLTVCAFYLFSPPRTFLTFSIYVSVHHSFPLLISISICSSSSRSSSLPPVSIWLRSCQLTLPPPPPRPLLCCCGPQKRSGQMVSDDFRALLISTGNSLVLLLAWCSLRVSAGLTIS